MADFSLSTNVNGEIVIIKTSGYLNNIGGEKIADACYKEIENGKSLFLLDLEDSKVVNSIGVSILIEIIFLYLGTSLKALLMAVVAIGFLYSRQVLVPLLNKNRDLANEGDQEAKKAFGSLHLRSVSINIMQMVLLIVVLTL